jgi:hypothetical protein
MLTNTGQSGVIRSAFPRRAEGKVLSGDCSEKGKPVARQGRKTVESGTELTR